MTWANKQLHGIAIVPGSPPCMLHSQQHHLHPFCNASTLTPSKPTDPLASDAALRQQIDGMIAANASFEEIKTSVEASAKALRDIEEDAKDRESAERQNATAGGGGGGGGADGADNPGRGAASAGQLAALDGRVAAIEGTQAEILLRLDKLMDHLMP
eukprot:SAG22_NODE_1335_length_4700_cov_2.556183_3_plen_157_part_00